MIIAVVCANCKTGEFGKRDSVSATIRIQKHDWCNSCGHERGNDVRFNFCSVSCLVEFVNKNPDKLTFEMASHYLTGDF